MLEISLSSILGGVRKGKSYFMGFLLLPLPFLLSLLSIKFIISTSIIPIIVMLFKNQKKILVCF